MNPLPFGAPPSHFLDYFAELKRQENGQPVTPPSLLDETKHLEELARVSLMHRIEVQDETNRSHGSTPAERAKINKFKKDISIGVNRAVRSHEAAKRAVAAAAAAELDETQKKTALKAFQAAQNAKKNSFAWGKKKGGTLRRKHRKSAKQRKSVKHRRS
jgi:hypothetical protein